LAKHAAQTIAGPLERAAVARDTKRHLGLDHLGGALVQREEAEKIGIRWRVEDDKSGVDIDGLFAWLRDVHCVGMASRAIICLVKMYFMVRVFIQEPGCGKTAGGKS
jgi:hypothetical protein